MIFRKKKVVEPERKVRTDKKQQIAPTITMTLKKEIERLSSIANQPIKSVGESLVIEGMRNKEVISRLLPFFQNGILNIDNSFYFGNADNQHFKDYEPSGLTDRISIRFEKYDYEDVQLLARILDVSPSRAVSEMLDVAIRHPIIVGPMLLQGVGRDPDESIKKDVKAFAKFVNASNPYGEKIDRSFISYLFNGKNQPFGITE